MANPELDACNEKRHELTQELCEYKWKEEQWRLMRAGMERELQGYRDQKKKMQRELAVWVFVAGCVGGLTVLLVQGIVALVIR